MNRSFQALRIALRVRFLCFGKLCLDIVGLHLIGNMTDCPIFGARFCLFNGLIPDCVDGCANEPECGRRISILELRCHRIRTFRARSNQCSQNVFLAVAADDDVSEHGKENNTDEDHG